MYATGLIPRDYKAYPSGYEYAAPSADESYLIPENEWEERLAEQKAQRASLLHMRNDYYDILKSLNQSSYPLCWGFSTTKAAMYELASQGLKLLLSPWWTAGMANGWKSQGGWCTLSLKALRELGCLPMTNCPSFSSQFATAENKALAAKRKVLEWADGRDDRDFNRALMISAFLRGKAPVLDLNHMGHSMCGCYLESITPKLVVYADNSWDAIDQYGPKGLYKLEDWKAVPDGIVVPRVVGVLE